MGAAWATERGFARRFVADLLAGELARARRSSLSLPPQPWDESTTLAQLGADSLEAVELATALARAIHLHRSGIEDALLARRTLRGWVDIAQAGLVQFHDELTFLTSGSTGLPKACTHPLAALEQEIHELAPLFHSRRRIVAAVPSHHIYGFLFTILLPQRLGLDAYAVVDARAASPASLASALRAGDLLVGHPDLWRAIASSGAAISPGALGVTSTAPCPDDTSAAVERSGIGALFHVYGSSETAGVAWRASWRDAYRLFGFWARAGDDEQALVRTVDDGRVVRARLQDHVEWLDARRFTLGARRDAAVQVGGVNVYPERVREVLLRHPGVRDAVVRLMRPEEGTRLKAFVVADAPMHAPDLEAKLREWIDARLTPPERPRAITIGPAVPRQENGKPADWALDAARS